MMMLTIMDGDHSLNAGCINIIQMFYSYQHANSSCSCTSHSATICYYTKNRVHCTCAVRWIDPNIIETSDQRCVDTFKLVFYSNNSIHKIFFFHHVKTLSSCFSLKNCLHHLYNAIMLDEAGIHHYFIDPASCHEFFLLKKRIQMSAVHFPEQPLPPLFFNF